MSVAAIEVRDLCRTFDDVDAVRGISFDITPGRVVGFIGANGAGKTTTMRILATLDVPSCGEVRVAGHDVLREPMRVREKLGWMPDSYGAYDNLTTLEYLDFFARAFGYSTSVRKTRVEEIVAFTDLGSLVDRDVSKLSRGMSQRLCLARALLNDPEVLILDEPAAGLDPKARTEFKRLVRALAAEGRTIFISSHILSELAEMCDELLFIDKGLLVHQGTAASLIESQAEHALVSVEVLDIAMNAEKLRQLVLLDPHLALIEMKENGALVRFSGAGDAELAEVLSRMIVAGLPVIGFKREEGRLEDAFIQLIGGVAQ
jgi:ABC-2 type transport system ATP-binding protein